MIFGNTNFQSFFSFLFKISLKGLNIGRGSNFKKSGELFVLKYLEKNINKKNNIVIFDVGANVGNYSNELIKVFEKKALIHAFEPSKFTFYKFLKNTEINKNIKPNNFGLSFKEDFQTLYFNQNGSSLASIYKRSLGHFGIDMNKSENIKLSSIDTYCQLNNISEIDFLKLDIEGHELEALKGAKEMLSNKKIRYIQFEFGGCNIDSRTFFKDFFFLLKDDFKIYRILSNGFKELSVYKETFEIFTTANYFAILK